MSRSYEGRTLFSVRTQCEAAEVSVSVFGPLSPINQSRREFTPGGAKADVHVSALSDEYGNRKGPELTAAELRALSADLLRAADALDRLNAVRCAQCGNYGSRCYGHEPAEEASDGG